MVIPGGHAAGQRISDPILADPVLPGGRIRLDFAPSFSTWDVRYGRRTQNGEVVDVDEALGVDLADAAVGGTLASGLATLRESVQALAQQPDYDPLLGTASGVVTRDVTRIDLGLGIGVFDWLTVGVTVPYVKTRAAVDLAFAPDPATDLGLNPASTDPDAVSTLLAALDAAAEAAEAQASSICEAGEGAECDAARGLSDEAGAFRMLARTAYTASPFFPVADAPVASRLESALIALNRSLASAGLPTVTTSMAFAASGITDEDFSDLPLDPSIRGAPLGTYEGLWTMGDIEIGGAVRLLDGEVRDSGAVSPRLAWTLSGGALVRLGTGTVDDPNIAFDLGSGDGQMDIEGRVDAALRVGAHLDVRGAVRYGVQRSGTLARRVARHEEVFAPVHTLRAVRWNPGDYRSMLISPRWHVGEALSIAVDLWRFEKDPDGYELLGPTAEGLPPVDPRALEHESGVTLHQVAFGLRYSTVPLARRGLTDTPVELGARVVRAVSGSGGNVPRSTRVELSVSLLRRIWGRR